MKINEEICILFLDLSKGMLLNVISFTHFNKGFPMGQRGLNELIIYVYRWGIFWNIELVNKKSKLFVSN